MAEALTVSGRAVAVDHRASEPDRIRLEVDGAVVDARVIASSAGEHAVEIDGRIRTIFTTPDGAGTWVWHRGRARYVERAPAQRRDAVIPSVRSEPVEARTTAPSRGSTGPPRPVGAVTPPMPAVVVAVLVEVGRRVARGDPLVVVTAMKTETQLSSPIAGRVRAVNAAVGAKVRPGDVLVEVSPEGDGG